MLILMTEINQYFCGDCVRVGEAGGIEWEGILRVAHGAQVARARAGFRVRLHWWIAHQMEIQVVVGRPHDQGTHISAVSIVRNYNTISSSFDT